MERFEQCEKLTNTSFRCDKIREEELPSVAHPCRTCCVKESEGTKALSELSTPEEPLTPSTS